MSILRSKHDRDDTPFGILHPTGYLIAAFADLAGAQQAADTLTQAGFSDDTVDAASGEDVEHAINNAHPPENKLEKLKKTLATTLGTEGWHWDRDLELAKAGAGFLSLYCEDEEQAYKAADLLRQHNPKTLRRYLTLAIEDLLQNPTPQN